MKLLVVYSFIFSLSFLSHSQCAYDNTFHSSVTPVCPGTVVANCINGGEYISIDVINGMQYSFSTCGGAWDTQLTLYDASGTSALGYNDDACGLQSIISAQATFTGTVHLLLDEYNCQNSGSCTDIEITCVAPVQLDSSNLPIVVINTAGGAAIPNEPKIDATMGIIYNGVGMINNITDPFNEFNGDIGIEIRGSSSGGFPKKQWGLETRDPSGMPTDVSIFNMAYDNDWVLYAPYSDKSLIRNVLAYQMGWDGGHYAPRTKLCEVVLNGEYQGVYVFTEKIKRKDGKVGINSVLPDDISGNELTGDYIFKVDKTTAGGIVAWTSTVNANTTDFQFHDPQISEINSFQLNYLQGVVTQWETALNGPNYTDPVNGHAPFIDMESFADFMLVNELTKNVDGYRISTYLNKRRDSEGGKIVAGPLWDFNLGLGNANYCQGGLTTGWEINFNNYCAGGLDNPFWWERLVQDPSFAKMLACRWAEMRQGPWHTDSLMTRIDNLATYLDQAQQRNFQKWQVLGTYLWPNNFVGNTYTEEINYLKTWLTDRANWMDANMFGSCPDLGLDENENVYLRVFPNPTSEFVTIESPILIADGELILFDPSGKIIMSVALDSAYSIQLNLTEFEQGIYQYKLTSNNNVSIGKITVL